MNKTSIKRILVALEPYDVKLSLLQAATTIATQLNAELDALVIEDINLFQIAELPFAREVVYGATGGRRVNLNDMERAIQLQSSRLRNLVESAAHKLDMPIRFKVLRGDVTNELCIASREADLLVMSQNTELLGYGRGKGGVASTVLSSTKCDLFLLQRDASIQRPIAVFFTGTDSCKRALAMAVSLVEQDHRSLFIVLPASIPGTETGQINEEIHSILNNSAVQATIFQLDENTVDALLESVKNSGAKMLLTGINPGVIENQDMRQLVEQNRLPVILLR